jgi:iron complex transport system ATP-binding protein
LDEITLSIDAGDRWAIIGKNGAGKSTLIRCIAGLEKLMSGEICIKERYVSTYTSKELALLIAYVPQTLGLQLPFTVYEYVMMGRFPYQGFMASASKKDKLCVTEALELTDTASLQHRLMNTLSGGEKQRVLLAGAVSQRTEILLLDEPAAFLDPLHQELLWQSLERIHKEYRSTILTVTHDVNTAVYYNDKVIALLDGRVHYAGNADVLIDNYDTLLPEIYGISFIRGVCKKENRVFVFPNRG